MSIVLDAIKRMQSLRAPKTASLSHEARPLVARGPLWRLKRRLLGLAALSAAVLAYVLVGHLREDGEPVPPRSAHAEIPWMAPLFASAPGRTAAPPRQAAEPRVQLAAGTAPAGPASAPQQARSMPPSLPAVAKFRPPTALSQPLPGPTATVPAGMVPGRVPAAPPIAGTSHPVAATAYAHVPAPAAAVVEAPRPLSDLPAELRSAAERVRAAVHVYAPHPRNRMLLVDGRQLREGDPLAEGLKVDEITPAGVVLRHGALRVLSPVMP
jgi:hypothetical protein